MSSTLLALDAGTTGVTACLFDRELRLLARAQQEFPQHFPQPGWVEHDAGEILGAVDRVLSELLTPLSKAERPLALGLCNQRETIFALERDSGKALGRGIVWQDRRTKARCDELREAGRSDWIQGRTGLLLDPYFSGSKIEWLRASDARLAERADRGEVVFATVDSLLIAHLTGGEAWLTEPTNGSRTMLMDLESRSWDPELCELFGLSAEQLPSLQASMSEFGVAQAPCMQGHNLPILGVLGDQQAALFGQGCVAAGDLKSTFGTGSFLLMNTGQQRVHSSVGLLSTVALDARGQAAHALEGSVFVAGAAVQWLRDGLGIIDEARQVEELARSVPSSEGVFFIPAFTGLGAPHWDAQARGALLGLTRGSGRGHIARATLEAIAFQNVELVEALRAETGLGVERLRADGGVSNNDLFMQLLADFGGLTTLRAESVEATARGAAALAGLASGLWESPLEAGFHSDPPQAFEPELGAEERLQRLAAWRAAVARVGSA